MQSKATQRFWRLYEDLPDDVRAQADHAYGHFRRDPRHPSLHFKKVGRFWSARVGRGYRALAIEIDDGYLWIWIGDHDDYERLIGAP